MGRFRKKPVVIEAVQWDETKETYQHLYDMGMRSSSYDPHVTENYVRNMYVCTFEGPLRAEKGDWIIKGVLGFYPCKPDVFDKTYEPVIEDTVSTLANP